MEILNSLSELRIIMILLALLLLPGWAMLAFTGLWRRWDGLQRWIVAIGLSIAFYPVLFYTTRSVMPFLTFGPYKMSAMFFLCLIIIGWRIGEDWKRQISFDCLEWAALAIFGMTMFTRFWIIRDHPYPAWSDSLHHAILTRLTAVQGQLPTTMESYFPIPLDQYHLGLYSLTATTQWLAQVPAHTALLWTAQALNGLCGLGVYLVLDRKVGRLGAVVGAAVVGLWSHQPAWYVNWGRFTQLSSQTILLIAWLVTWEAIASWSLSWQEHRIQILWNTAFAALLTSVVFLLHFRVAVFYLPLLAMSVVWELWKARKKGVFPSVFLGITLIGVLALILITPTLWKAMRVHISTSLEYAQMDLAPDEISAAVEQFFKYEWSSVPLLVAQPWLLWIACFGAVIGLWKLNKLVIASFVWIVVLYSLGNSYVWGISFLNFTNLGAVLIMLYLPIGLIVGSMMETLALYNQRWRDYYTQGIIALTLVIGFTTSHIRATDIDLSRYFITSADIEAMQWIKDNTPEDALFAVNTHFWLSQAPHGTDAGYWIPYFTGRRTTAGVMLLNLASQEYKSKIVSMSQSVMRLENDDRALSGLQAQGVDYIYIGQRGDFFGSGLKPEQLKQIQELELLYQNADVAIFRISSVESRFFNEAGR
jgi:hypothetical protein